MVRRLLTYASLSGAKTKDSDPESAPMPHCTALGRHDSAGRAILFPGYTKVDLPNYLHQDPVLVCTSRSEASRYLIIGVALGGARPSSPTYSHAKVAGSQISITYE